MSGANWSCRGLLFPRGLHLSVPLAAGEFRQEHNRPCTTLCSPTPMAAPSPALPPVRSTSSAPTPTPAATMRTSGPASTRMTNSIWEDTAVVGVTPAIYNDTISVSKTIPDHGPTTLRSALAPRRSSTSATPRRARKSSPSTATTAISPRRASDYDSERAAQEMIQALNSAA